MVYGIASFTGSPLEAAQPKIKIPPVPKPVKPPPTPKQAAKQAAKQVPADTLQKLLNMSPEDREKTLSKMTPAQRTRAENQLSNLDKMTPQNRAKSLDRISRLEKLPPVRQAAVKQQLQSLNGMTIPERRTFLHSPEFEKNFSPEEQQLIRDQYPGAAK
jgi:hypothetical protein